MPKQELDGLELFDLALSIVGLVSSHGDRQVSELAEIFEVSERAILRAVRAISDSENLSSCETHFYLNYDELEDGWVSFSQGRSNLSGPPNLSRRQLSAIAMGLDYLASLPQFAANEDLEKLRGLLSQGVTELGEIPDRRLISQVQQIQHALEVSKSLNFEYQNQLGERTQRQVDPLRLDFVGKRHYLRGYCLTTDAVKSFRLDRITSLEIADRAIAESSKTATVPEEVFGLANQEIRVMVAALPEAAEIFWNFPSTNEPKLKDGRLVGEIFIGNLSSLPRHIVRYGGMVEVIGPEPARKIVREFSSAVLTREEA